MAAIDGDEDDNLLPGTASADVITGFGGDDTIIGGGGADQQSGGAGNDVFRISSGLNVVAGEMFDGGEGVDTISYTGASGGSIDFSGAIFTSIESLDAAGQSVGLTRSQMDGLSGTIRAATVTLATTGSVRLEGSVVEIGTIVLNAGGGNVALYQATGAIGEVTGQGGDDTISGSALFTTKMSGGGGHDMLIAGRSGDTLSGGEGNDTLLPPQTGSFDVTGIVFDGGNGDDQIFDGVSDALDYSSATITGVETYYGPGRERILTAAQMAGFTTGFFGGDVTIAGGGVVNLAAEGFFESLTLSDAGNEVYLINPLFEASGYIIGGMGNDIVQLGDISRTVFGGGGNDRLTGSDLFGEDGNDVLTAVSESSRLDGGAGTDTLIGGPGDDVFYNPSSDLIAERAGGGTDTVVSDFSFTLSGRQHVENLLLSGAANITGSGNSYANALTGNDGDNVLDGAGGIDTMLGGRGNDVFRIGSGLDVVAGEIFDGGEDVDTISYTGASGGSIDFSGAIFTSIESLDAAGQSVVLTRSQMDGLSGTIRAETIALATAGDVSLEGSAVDIDTLVLNAGGNRVSLYDTTGRIDEVVGGDGRDNILGSEDYSTVMSGGGGNDTLIAGSTGDRLFGGEGNDVFIPPQSGAFDIAGITFDGGNGDDTMSDDIPGAVDFSATTLVSIESYFGYTGSRTFTAEQMNGFSKGLWVDVVTISTGGLIDFSSTKGMLSRLTLSDAGNEVYLGTLWMNGGHIWGGRGNDIVHSAGQYVTVFGGAGNDRLSGVYLAGEEGNDVLTAGPTSSTLDGGAGTDTLIGALGDDHYYNPTGDVIIERADGGSDTISSIVSFTLSGRQQVENLELGGTGDINASGNSYDNRLTGNSSDNVLDGSTGSDTMSGGRGNDRYYVDRASDETVEDHDGGTDLVVTMVSRTLGENIENLSLNGSGSIDGNGNGLANVISGNAGANILRGYGGADTLMGHAGADILLGGAGRDVLRPGADSSRDTIRVAAVVDSTSAGRDIVHEMDLDGEDRFDFPAVPALIRAQVSVGALSAATFDADLAAAVGAEQLGAGEAVLFDPSAGDLNDSGRVYLIVDANGVAGYQAGADFVVELSGHTGALSLDDFV